MLLALIEVFEDSPRLFLVDHLFTLAGLADRLGCCGLEGCPCQFLALKYGSLYFVRAALTFSDNLSEAVSLPSSSLQKALPTNFPSA